MGYISLYSSLSSSASFVRAAATTTAAASCSVADSFIRDFFRWNHDARANPSISWFYAAAAAKSSTYDILKHYCWFSFLYSSLKLCSDVPLRPLWYAVCNIIRSPSFWDDGREHRSAARERRYIFRTTACSPPERRQFWWFVAVINADPAGLTWVLASGAAANSTPSLTSRILSSPAASPSHAAATTVP